MKADTNRSRRKSRQRLTPKGQPPAAEVEPAGAVGAEAGIKPDRGARAAAGAKPGRAARAVEAAAGPRSGRGTRAAELAAGKPASPTAATPSGYIYVRREILFGMALALTFALGLGAGYLIWGSSRAGGEVSQASGRIEVSLDDDPRLGPDDAPITIVEFSDFNCPFCRAWHQQTFPGLMQSFPDQILFVYKDFPVVGGGTIGEGAALAANCAAEQGGFWDYHDALFSGEYSLDRTGFERAAIASELDGEALLTCLDSGRYAEEVQEDLRYGAGLGVTGTPTFFINGIPLVGAQPLLRFVEVVNGELGRP